MMPEDLTYMTDAHKAVIARLEKWGLGVMEEIDFPPFRADIYLPDFHAVVEVDGPRHAESADRRRDRELGRAYGLYVFHVAAEDARSPAKWRQGLVSFLKYAMKNKQDRWEQHEMGMPWI